ncbi:hypothetical protein UFOVP621_93 [uncultured Caudovirales phage]|uniref:Uncharacterized protein n=1 Tax=uncultured Caudovirales phage TaxID=2100421 RepID=A0A6J5N4L5_9CAUD|nr:hypothetical protein UFOVP621_93 [uncultured Caudovirales phage]
MFIVNDPDTQSMIGGFNTNEDAISFIAKVESMSNHNITSLEVYEVVDADEWLFDNMDNLIMSNC